MNDPLQLPPPTYSRDRIPAWLKDVPTYVLLDDETLAVYLYGWGLPTPSSATLEGERRYRRFLADGEHA